MSDEELYRLHIRGMSYRDIASTYGLNQDGIRGRVGRYRRRLKYDISLGVQCDLPLVLTGDWLIAGDVHIPAHSNAMIRRFKDVALHWLEPPRRCILAGDIINADAFSVHDSVTAPPAFETELKAARSFFDDMLTVFDQVIVLPGNHDRRLAKRTRGALGFPYLMRMISSDSRLIVSNYGYATLDTPKGTWLITHGSQYSVTPLTHAERMAWKHDCNIISHHEHRVAIGHDRYGRYTVINNGGLFDQAQLAYTWLDSSSRPGMVGGFTMLRRGCPYVFTGWVDWEFWLGGHNGR